MPSFELSVTDLLLALSGGLFVASALSSFGATLFGRLVMPPIARRLEANARGLIERRYRAIVYWSLVAACLVGLAWLVLEAHVMAETHGLGETLSALPTVLFDTRFGQILALQALALAGASAAVAINRRPSVLAACVAGLATLLEAGHSHAFAMAHGPSALLLSQSLHLLAAGAWLGGLLPLLMVVRETPLDIAELAARRFSTLGFFAVAILATTALFQGAVLSGGLQGLTGTAYGAVLLTKAVLFAALVLLAALNRLRFTPALAGPHGERDRRALLASITVETAIGLCVVLAASVLSGFEPGMHASGA
jgi:putative copper resistance protein D